jgi:hypothetical protein
VSISGSAVRVLIGLQTVGAQTFIALPVAVSLPDLDSVLRRC